MSEKDRERTRIAMGKEINAAIRAEEEQKMRRMAAEREREKAEAAAARAKIREKLDADRCGSTSAAVIVSRGFVISMVCASRTTSGWLSSAVVPCCLIPVAPLRNTHGRRMAAAHPQHAPGLTIRQ